MSLVTGWIVTPIMPRCTLPCSISCVMTFFAMFAGIAKPMPMLPPDGVRICELMPISSPAGADQRAAGVALVDRGIRLDEVLEAPSPLRRRRAPLGADDAHRHGLADAERVADREHDVADAHRVGVAERQRLQVGAVDLQDRQIARLHREPTTLALKLRPSVSSTFTCSAPSTTWWLVRM